MKKTNWSELISEAKTGKESAIRKIYDLTSQKVYFTVSSMMPNEDDAFDVIQNTYIKVFNKLDTLESPEKFQSWLLRIASNECKRALSKKKDTLFSEIEMDDGRDFSEHLENDIFEYKPDDSVDYSETKRLVTEILEKLPEEQRMVILMFYFEEMSLKEIAEALDCSENTVKSRLLYAKKKIKAEAEELEKKGTKLYNLTLFPFFIWLLRRIGDETAVPQRFSSGVYQAVSEARSVNAPPDTASASASSSGAASEVAGSVVKTGFSVAEKIMSVVVAVSVVVCGGVFTKNYVLKETEEPITEATSLEIVDTTLPEAQVPEEEPYVDLFTQLGLKLSQQGTPICLETWSETGPVELYITVNITETTDGVEDGFKTVSAVFSVDASRSETRFSFSFGSFDKYGGYILESGSERVQADIEGGFDDFVEFQHDKTGENILVFTNITSEQIMDDMGGNMAYFTYSVTVPLDYDGVMFYFDKADGLGSHEEYDGLKKINDSDDYVSAYYFAVE